MAVIRHSGDDGEVPSVEVPLWERPKCKPNCAACPFATNGSPPHRPVLGEAPVNNRAPQAVLIGEGPGHDEVQKQRPFVGKTGQWLDARLNETGHTRGLYLILNATACQPPRGMKNDHNMGAATAACRPLFLAQYNQYTRLPTLAMGKWAGAAANKGHPISVETGRGFIRDNLLLTWHPTYAAFYNPWKAGEFVNDLERFKRLLGGTLERPPELVIRPSVKDIARLVSQAKKRFDGVVAVDIETRAPDGQPDYLGKDPTRAELKTIAMGTPDLGVAYWWASDMAVQRVIIRWLTDKTLLKVFHNGWFFDLRVLARKGIVPFPVRDTRDMRRAVSATSRLSLRYLASIYADFPPWKEDEK